MATRTSFIDTSDLTPHDLRERIREAFAESPPEHGLKVSLISFGFKYGAPRDSDLMLDVRFLPNPYWIEELRPLTGVDEQVRAYVEGQPQYRAFVERLEALLDVIVPGYVAEGKSYLTIAVGCTGGQAPVGRRGRGARQVLPGARPARRRRAPGRRPGLEGSAGSTRQAASLGWAPKHPSSHLEAVDPRRTLHDRQDRRERLRPDRPQLLPRRRASGADIEIVAANDIMDTKTAAHLLKYDSVHGRLDADMPHDRQRHLGRRRRAPHHAERDPANLPWKELGAEIVIESTG